MGLRTRLRGGIPARYRDHRGGIGARYVRVANAIARELGVKVSDAFSMLEVSRIARLLLEWEAALERLEQARTARAEGQGRRPSEGAITKLERHAHLANAAYQDALDALRGKQWGGKW